MLKGLGIVLVAFALIGCYGYAQAHKTQQAQADQKPASPGSQTGDQTRNSQSPETQSQQHIQADVRIIESPKKDAFDKTALGVSVVLALVGILGVWVGIKTLRFLSRQATEMLRQRIIMRRTMNTVRRQTDILADSLAAAKDAAQAAKDSADAALLQVKSMKSRDRARVSLDLDPFQYDERMRIMWAQKVTWRVHLFGQSEAHNVRTKCILCLGRPESHPWFDHPLSNFNLPSTMRPEHRERSGDIIIHFQTGDGREVKDVAIDEMKSGKIDLYCIGKIEFTDVYGDEWVLPFRRRWVYFQSSNTTIAKLAGAPEGFWYNDGDNEERQRKP